MKKCILIIGMHRSGTSALAGALEKLGVEFGNNLLPASEDNPRGFFEDENVVELNDFILYLLGSNWYDLRDLPDDPWNYPFLEKVEKDAIALIKNTFRSNLFAIKDPRFCLTLPFWLNIFKKLNIATTCLISRRHPVETANSLVKRNGFHFADSLLLWSKYTLLFEESTRAQSRYFVDFDNLLEQPKKALGDVQNFLKGENIDLENFEERREIVLTTFLEKSLKHQRKHEIPVHFSATDFIEETHAFIQSFEGKKTLKTAPKTSVNLLRDYTNLYEEKYTIVDQRTAKSSLYFSLEEEVEKIGEDELLDILEIDRNQQIIDFQIDKLKEDAVKLVWRPFNCHGSLRIKNIQLLKNKAVVQENCDFSANATYVLDGLYIFNTVDPNYYIDLPKGKKDFNRVKIEFDIKAIKEDGMIVNMLEETHGLSTTLYEAREELIETHKTLSVKDEELIETHKNLTAKDEELIETHKVLTAKDEELIETHKILTTKDEELIKTYEELTAKDEELIKTHEELTTRDEELIKTHEILSAKDEELVKTHEELTARDEELIKTHEILTAKDEELVKTHEELTTRDEELVKVHEDLSKHVTELTQANADLFEVRTELRTTHETLKSRDEELVKVHEELSENVAELTKANSDLFEVRTELRTTHTKLSEQEALVTEMYEDLYSTRTELRQTHGRLSDVSQDYDTLDKVHFEFKKSLSSRVGFAITAPIRWVYELFVGEKSGWLKVGTKVAKTAVTNPKIFLSYLNPRNFKTLYAALQKESAADISKNFGKLVNKMDIERAVDGNPNNIKFNIDEVGNIAGYLILRGWATAPYGVGSIELLQKDGSAILVKHGQPRPDIAAAFPKFQGSGNAGFYLRTPLEESIKNITIRVTDKKGGDLEIKSDVVEVKDVANLNFDEQYQIYLEQRKLSETDIESIKEKALLFRYQPKVSIITPVYNVEPQWLDLCIESLLNQYYPNWELCLYDDASPKQETIDCLKKWEGQDERIKIRFGKENKHIAGASNEAIEMATGEFIGLLDNDDELTPDAIYEVVNALNENDNIDFFYSDEDKISIRGDLSGPYFKSDFSIDLLRSNNYICHFSVIRKTIGDKVGWFRQGYDGAQDHDLVLRIIDETHRIHHISKVLYHWRTIPGSTATAYAEKDYVFLSGKKAIEDHLKRNNIEGTVEKGEWGGAFRVRYDIKEVPLVSIIIPFKDQVGLLKTCVESIFNKTTYPNLELILVSNNSKESKTHKYLKSVTRKYQKVKVFEYDVPFNYSKINNWGVKQAEGDLILLLNNDTEVITEGWLEAMVEPLQRKEVGAVGAKLLYDDDTIQHAGVVLGLGGSAGHVFKGRPDGYHYFNMGVLKNVSACTAACLMIKKEVYEEVGGLDEENLKVAYNDIDFCLRIRAAGYLITYTPYAKLYHYESKSRGYEDTPEKKARHDKEKRFLKNKWGETLVDPYYNINFTLEDQSNAIGILSYKKSKKATFLRKE